MATPHNFKAIAGSERVHPAGHKAVNATSGGELVTATVIVSRLLRGAWSDLSWRHEVGRPVRLARWRARRGWWCLIALMVMFGAAQVWLVYRVYPDVDASVRAAIGISNAPGTRTSATSVFLAPDRSSPS